MNYWLDALDIMNDGFRVHNPDFRYIEYFYKNDEGTIMIHYNDGREWPFDKTSNCFIKMCNDSAKWDIYEDSSDLFEDKPLEPWHDYLAKVWAFFQFDNDVMPTVIYTGETDTVHNVVLYVKDPLKAMALQKIIKEDARFGEHVVHIEICNTSNDIDNKEYEWSKKLIELNDSAHILWKALSNNGVFSHVYYSFNPCNIRFYVVFMTKIAQDYAEDIFNIPTNCIFTNCENEDTEDTFNDNIHPSHYTAGRKYEPKDVIRDWGLNFNLGSAVKYISRAGRKDDILADLNKAKQFLEFEITALEEEKS
jgi:hypothetical protein